MSDIAAFVAQYTDAKTGNLTGVPVEVLLKILANGGPKEESGKRKTRKTKDPNAPKRGRNAYMLWLGENRSRIKEALVEAGKDSKVSEVSKVAGEEWKGLSEDEKLPYQKQAAEEKVAYQKAMEEYTPSVRVEKYDPEDYPTAPEGWTGPYELKYLSRYVKGPDGSRRMIFKSFSDAVEAAAGIEECGGITKESRGYTLRMGSDLITDPTEHHRQGLASWVKGSVEVPKVMVMEGMVDGKTMGGATGGAPAPKKVSKKVKVADAEPEPEPVMDAETEEEVCEVEEFIHDGKEFVYDGEGNIYDPEGDGETILGKYVDGVANWN